MSQKHALKKPTQLKIIMPSKLHVHLQKKEIWSTPLIWTKAIQSGPEITLKIWYLEINKGKHKAYFFLFSHISKIIQCAVLCEFGFFCISDSFLMSQRSWLLLTDWYCQFLWTCQLAYSPSLKALGYLQILVFMAESVITFMYNVLNDYRVFIYLFFWGYT